MLQVYDSNMTPLRLEDKKVVHKEGLWHKVITAIFYNVSNGSIYFQTIYPKEGYGFVRPDYLDVTVGGHIEENDTPLETLWKETEEEIGYKLNRAVNYEPSVIRKINCDPSPTYKIREFQYLYFIPVVSRDENQIGYDPEVKSIVEINAKDLNNLLNKEVETISCLETVYDKQTRKKVSTHTRVVSLQDFIPDYLTNGFLDLITTSVLGKL